MKKETLLEKASTPDGKTIGLFEHDGDYTIRIDGVELMSTRRHASEEKLAELTCAPLARSPHPRVLIGGLGFGFTLKAALALLPKRAVVVVAELLEAVIRWNRNPAYRLAAAPLADPRVELKQTDVAEVLTDPKAPFDAILLDVDNGPAALTLEKNLSLYQKSGVLLAKKALGRAGCLAYWSAVQSPAFEKLLRSCGLTVEVHQARAHGNSGSRHTIFLARVSG